MKKLIVIGLILALLAMAVTGCGNTTTDNGPTATPTSTPTSTPQPSGDAAVKTGLSIMTSLSKSKDAGEADGLAQANTVIIAVTVDSAGVVQDCAIDYAQTKINFSTSGVITTDKTTVFAGKQELGDDYGMKKASAIGKEWYEQADALADYVIGKTLAEVKGIDLNDEGVATDAELASSVTIGLGDYIAGIEDAIENATEMGAKAGDKVGIGVMTTVDKSKDATAEANGLAQAYTSIAAVTVNSSNEVTSCIIDAVQANVNFDTTGKIVTDLTVGPKTKNQLGEDYGMKKVSAIGKEWNEQAASFAEYVKGKSLAEIQGIALNEEGVPSEAELTSTVTVHVGPFITTIEKAINLANN